ncbi:hypothetical protein [Ktedonobacter racemifer]|uniref:Transcriptional regulator n=1 Tax=Ktedonobacter racemifer DSM 44963 TaxID=485913 RepID=D6U270_KTERA|nr:hypothetical protein [Ktedonobacter racemifer]EFH82738.1 transcriptional regulator [Ktedonobacter racemifer DSM 44963]
MIKAYFDSPAFLQAIDQIRLDRKLSWYQVTKATGLDPNNIRRVGTREKNGFNSNAVAALVLWSGLDPREYMKWKNS